MITGPDFTGSIIMPVSSKRIVSGTVRIWTAHGFKSLPIPVSMTWKLDSKNRPIVAMPPLEDLLSSKAIASLHGELSRISPCQFDDSYAVRKNITRVPLKSPLPEDESLLDGHSADGLHSFYPVDLYQDNIVSIKGLVAVFPDYKSWRDLR